MNELFFCFLGLFVGGCFGWWVSQIYYWSAIEELKDTLADAMGWNWHDEDVPPEVIKRCQKVLNDE